MRAKHFLGVALVGSGVAVLGLGAGCGSNAVTGTGGSTSSSSTTTSSHSTTTVATSSGTGGTGGGGSTNHSFATASPITVGAAATMATLKDTATADYYTFTGHKGERMIMTAQSQALITTTGHDPNDATVTDTVITVYLPDMATVWSGDDDGWPRISTDSQLFTELPMDGTYYVTVEDCNAYAPSGCAPPMGVTTFDYALVVADVLETKGSATALTALTYKLPTGAKAGQYGDQVVGGDFSAATDVQIFTFTPPADLLVDPAARARANFFLQPVGATNGDGSAAKVTLIAKDMAGNVISKSDQQNYADGDNATDGPLNFSFPITAAKPYTIEVHNEGLTSDPTKNYFFIYHEIVNPYYDQPEAEVAGGHSNDTEATAEVVKVPTGDTGAYFVDGNISDPTDLDYYSMVVPAPTAPATTVGIVEFDCEAARNGDGLIGFTAQVYTDIGDAGPTALATLPAEAIPPKKDLYVSLSAPLPLPAGATKVYLKVSAASADASTPPNTGTAYHCTVAMQ